MLNKHTLIILFLTYNLCGGTNRNVLELFKAPIDGRTVGNNLMLNKNITNVTICAEDCLNITFCYSA